MPIVNVKHRYSQKVGKYVSFTFLNFPLYQTFFDPPIYLPTYFGDGEPDIDPQINITVSSDIAPTIEVNCNVTYIIQKILYVFVVGYSPSYDSDCTIESKVYKNGQQIQYVWGGGGFISPFYWTGNYFVPVEYNDVISIKLWVPFDCSSSTYFNFVAYQVNYTRLKIEDIKEKICAISINSVYTATFSFGNPSIVQTGDLYIYDYFNNIVTLPLSYYIPSNEYGLFRIYYGDFSDVGSNIRASTSYYPYYFRSTIPRKIDIYCYEYSRIEG